MDWAPTVNMLLVMKEVKHVAFRKRKLDQDVGSSSPVRPSNVTTDEVSANNEEIPTASAQVWSILRLWMINHLKRKGDMDMKKNCLH